jgi:predicted MFS family arabinose efflux permease
MCSSGARQVLGPIVADRALGGATAWGTILAFQSAGLIVGGVIALRLRPQRPLLVGVLGLFLWGVTIPALALELPVLVIAVLGLIGGIGVELFGVYWDTALQQHVPRHALSRVSSYDALGSIVAIPIGLAIAGPIADGIGVSTTLWVAFALMTAAVGGALLSRDVRTLPRRDPEPTPV